MKIVCIICTELLVASDHISVCTCGHLFHEECLFRWFKSGGPNTCPQCRAKQPEKNVIKRLYFNEQDIAQSQIANLSEVSAENHEHLQNIVVELKNSLIDLRQTVATKSKLIEEKEIKYKELEKSVTNTKKTLSENQLLLDYLKKELENYTKLKEQYDARERFITQLESKLREYKSIEMIYKEHEHTFANEMNKYLQPVMGKANNISHYQSIVRQLVSTNVLLKESADKQMEEKRLIRKKLITSESSRSEREKKLQTIEKYHKEQQYQNDKLREENKRLKLEFESWKKKAQTALAKRTNPNSFLHDSMSTPTLNKENLVVNDTLQIDDINVSVNTSMNPLNHNVSDCDNDLKTLEELNNLNGTIKSQGDVTENGDETDIIEMRCNSMFSREEIDFLNSPVPKRRKNPFISYDLNDQDSKAIPTFQEPKKSKLNKFKSFNELSLSQRFNESPTGIPIVKPIVSGGVKRSRPRLMDEIDVEAESSSSKTVPKKINAFTYLSDGFGGRTKVLNKNDKIMPLGGVKLGRKASFLTKSKISK